MTRRGLVSSVQVRVPVWGDGDCSACGAVVVPWSVRWFDFVARVVVCADCVEVAS